ncbi:MAG: hypothetical protein DWQ31_04955 [Planctomycetota bacterium]|nr:MAG: hypothetical protein DWQ31_04955 [Planctomycetota bacterium]REJ87886.1 MAG: hypothetical protein DWQ35_20845 [Planctomycetota bacterium]
MVVRHLQNISLLRGRRVTGGQVLIACATTCLVWLSASAAEAQYGPNYSAPAPRYAGHYGIQNGGGYARPVVQNAESSSPLFPRQSSYNNSYFAPEETVDPPPAPGHHDDNGGDVAEKIWSDSCSDGGCGDSCWGGCDLGCGHNPCGCHGWYAEAYGLIMTRNHANRVWTSFESGNNPNQLTHTQDADVDWVGGWEVAIGRCLPCYCGWALEARYWQLEEFNGFVSTTFPGGSVSTPLDVAGIEFGATGAGTWFDGADEHRLSRRNQISNFEVNLVNHNACHNCGPWSVGGIVGFRYFRFDEDLTFATLQSGGSWNVPTDTAFMVDNIENELFGFQVGANVRRQMRHNLAFTFTPKVGIFANHIENRFDVFRGDGLRATPTAASGAVGTYPVNGSADTISFMLEANVGLAWQFHPRWEATVGYRVVALTGIGLADHQIPPFIVDFPELEDVDINGDLILHGGYAGLTYRF